jgi:hypothetical protein
MQQQISSLSSLIAMRQYGRGVFRPTIAHLVSGTEFDARD